MKSYLLLVTLLIIIFCHWSSASSTEMEQRKTSAMQRIGNRLRSLWGWIWKGQGQSFVGRCFGVARKLKFVIPMIIFKLGVIVTILVFLTIFSLKGLALLVLLVLLNSSGLVAKWVQAKQEKESKPQDVHFHLHSKDFYKSSHYGGHSEYEHDGWNDRNEVDGTVDESLRERLKKLNIYDDGYFGKY